MTAEPIVAEVVRSGFVESTHRGRAVCLSAGGGVAVRRGDIDAPMFPRSANKPMQAIAMLRRGLDLDRELLALAAASHSGEDFHVAGVKEILHRAGLDSDALQCPAALPLDDVTAMKLMAAGGGADRLHMNCSGKHAAMLATCVVNDWPIDTYLLPDHPLQAAIRGTVERLSGESVAAVGVDGCGAPLFAISLHGLAKAFRAIVTAAPGTQERLVADTMRRFPQWTSGTARADRALMAGVAGLLVKSGAEGVTAFALPDGRAGALKINDGGSRAVPAVTVALLRALDVREPALAEIGATPVLGGGRGVGEVRATAVG